MKIMHEPRPLFDEGPLGVNLFLYQTPSLCALVECGEWGKGNGLGAGHHADDES